MTALVDDEKCRMTVNAGKNLLKSVWENVPLLL